MGLLIFSGEIKQPRNGTLYRADLTAWLHHAGILARGIPAERQETAQFQASEFSVSETGRVAVLQLRRSDQSSPYDIQLGFYTVDGSAVAGIDYQAMEGVVVFPAFTTNITISIPVFYNDKADGIRTFQVVLSNLTEGLLLGNNPSAEVRAYRVIQLNP